MVSMVKCSHGWCRFILDSFCALFNVFFSRALLAPTLHRQSLPCWTTSPTISELWETTCWQRSFVGKYLKILLWVSIITSLGAGTFRSGGVCILNQAVFTCTQAGLHYSCLLQPLRSLEVVGTSGAANFVAQRTNSLISHATTFCLICNSSKSCLLIPQWQRTHCTALCYNTSITRNSQGSTCLDLR